MNTGGVGAEPTYSRTSWTAPALEVGKSPTEVPRARTAAARGISVGNFQVRFVSSSSSWSLNYALLDTGADMVVHYH